MSSLKKALWTDQYCRKEGGYKRDWWVFFQVVTSIILKHTLFEVPFFLPFSTKVSYFMVEKIRGCCTNSGKREKKEKKIFIENACGLKKYSDHLFLVRAANIDPETLAYWVCCKKHNSGYRGEKLCVESSLLVKVCFRPTPHLQKRVEQGGQGPLNCIIAHFRRTIPDNSVLLDWWKNTRLFPISIPACMVGPMGTQSW